VVHCICKPSKCFLWLKPYVPYPPLPCPFIQKRTTSQMAQDEILLTFYVKFLDDSVVTCDSGLSLQRKYFLKEVILWQESF